MLLKQLQDDPSYKGVNVTLTGHSLGGAVAQLVGSVATGLNVTTFDAPGPKGLLTQPYSNSKSTGLKGTYTNLFDAISAAMDGVLGLSNFTPDLDRTTINYRLEGDQVSMAGRTSETTNQLGRVISVPNIDGNKDVCANGCTTLSALLNYEYILASHNLVTLTRSIDKYCSNGSTGVSCVEGFNGEPNSVAENSTLIGAAILGVVQGTCLVKSHAEFLFSPLLASLPGMAQTVSTGSMNAFCETLNKRLVAGTQAVDPPPGNAYLVQLNSGSPLFGSFSLPALGSIFGWTSQYHDQFGWSAIQASMGAANFQFASGVDEFAFVPLDALGNQTFNPDSFYFGFSTVSDGDFSATVFAFGNPDVVPEPAGLLLFLTAGAALLAFHRKRKLVMCLAAGRKLGDKNA